MNKKYIVKESKTFDEIIESGKKIKNYNYIIFYKESNENVTKYGITVPKKVGKAHIRNKLKRRVKSIIRNSNKTYEKNYNCIIIIRNSCLELSYYQLKDSLEKILSKIK